MFRAPTRFGRRPVRPARAGSPGSGARRRHGRRTWSPRGRRRLGRWTACRRRRTSGRTRPAGCSRRWRPGRGRRTRPRRARRSGSSAPRTAGIGPTFLTSKAFAQPRPFPTRLEHSSTLAAARAIPLPHAVASNSNSLRNDASDTRCVTLGMELVLLSWAHNPLSIFATSPDAPVDSKAIMVARFADFAARAFALAAANKASLTGAPLCELTAAMNDCAASVKSAAAGSGRSRSRVSSRPTCTFAEKPSRRTGTAHSR